MNEQKKAIDMTPEELKSEFYRLACTFYVSPGNERTYVVLSGLNENKDFIKVFLIIIIVQALLVNAAIVPLAPFQWIGEMFSCVPFGIKGWIAVVLLACTMIPADMVRKLCVNK